jgi:hypothetical protein
MADQQRLVQHGFTNIEVEKSKLLGIIKSNKDKHIAEYNKAVIAYETAKLAYAQEYWAQLAENIVATKKIWDDKLESVAAAVIMAREANEKEGGVIDLKNINISVLYNLNPKVSMTVAAPVSHEKDYSTAIRGLELSTAEFVYLDQSNFSKYVLDEWDWKPTFSNNINVLTSGCSMVGNSYFNNSVDGIRLSGSFISTASGTSSLGSVSNPWTSTYDNSENYNYNLGENSMSLFNSIVNSTTGEK